jgi:hypothetical protein
LALAFFIRSALARADDFEIGFLVKHDLCARDLDSAAAHIHGHSQLRLHHQQRVASTVVATGISSSRRPGCTGENASDASDASTCCCPPPPSSSLHIECFPVVRTTGDDAATSVGAIGAPRRANAAVAAAIIIAATRHQLVARTGSVIIIAACAIASTTTTTTDEHAAAAAIVKAAAAGLGLDLAHAACKRCHRVATAIAIAVVLAITALGSELEPPTALTLWRASSFCCVCAGGITAC